MISEQDRATVARLLDQDRILDQGAEPGEDHERDFLAGFAAGASAEVFWGIWQHAYDLGVEDERQATAADLGIGPNRTNPFLPPPHL